MRQVRREDAQRFEERDGQGDADDEWKHSHPVAHLAFDEHERHERHDGRQDGADDRPGHFLGAVDRGLVWVDTVFDLRVDVFRDD